MNDSKNYYDSIAKKYDEIRRWNGPIPKRMVEIGRISKVTKVLDLGCGTGNLISAVWTASGCIPYGLDASQEMLEIAKGKVKGGTFVKGDVTDIPFPDDFFDCVIGALFVHHVPPNLRTRVMQEGHRVLSSGHLIILTMSHELIKKMGFAEFFPEALEITEKGFPKISELEGLFKDSGFTKVTSEIVNDSPITIEEFYHMAKNKVISAMDKVSSESYEKGMERLLHFIKTDPKRTFERPMVIAHGKKE